MILTWNGTKTVSDLSRCLSHMAEVAFQKTDPTKEMKANEGIQSFGVAGKGAVRTRTPLPSTMI